ncbi:MAG: hypothetical protein HY369_01405 [Candidatus Aenigmarchaeota archaeon]|nr:hypothetical protein [Candidatus Aenigmarchaeota archaeon]
MADITEGFPSPSASPVGIVPTAIAADAPRPKHVLHHHVPRERTHPLLLVAFVITAGALGTGLVTLIRSMG